MYLRQDIRVAPDIDRHDVVPVIYVVEMAVSR
jgi:hypothetical protein